MGDAGPRAPLPRPPRFPDTLGGPSVAAPPTAPPESASAGLHLRVLGHAPPSAPPLPDHGRPVGPEGKAVALTVINAVGIEKLKWKKHTGMNRRHGLSRGPPLVRLPPLPPLNALGRSLSHEWGCFLFFPPARTKC